MLSPDFRGALLKQCDDGGSVRVVAMRNGVSPTTVQKLKKQRAETGGVEPKPHGGGPKRKLDKKDVDRVEKMILRKVDITNDEIVARLAKSGKIVSVSTVSRRITERGISRKKRPIRRAKQTAATS